MVVVWGSLLGVESICQVFIWAMDRSITYRKAYSVAGKIYLRQQVEDQKEHAI